MANLEHERLRTDLPSGGVEALRRLLEPTALVEASAAALIEAPIKERALVVVPCLNEVAFIGPLIASLRRDPGLDDPLILVADGGSTDGARELVAEIAARDPCVQLLPNPKQWQGAGVNLAARMLGEDRTWLVRVDAHAAYPEGYVSSLIDEARRTGAASVVVSLDTQGQGVFGRAVAAAQNSLLGTGGAAHRREGASGWVDHGHHALVRLDAFRALRGYDESFSHNEDAEFDHRLSRHGGRIWLTDRVRVIYYPRSTARALWKQYLHYGRGRARTVLKHRAPLKIRQAVPLAVAPAVALAMAAPLHWTSALPLLAWAAASVGYGMVVGLRRREPAALMSGFAAMEMHLAWSIGFWLELLLRRGEAAANPAAPSPVTSTS